MLLLPTYPKHRSHSLEGTESVGGGEGSLTNILMSLLLLSDERSIYNNITDCWSNCQKVCFSLKENPKFMHSTFYTYVGMKLIQSYPDLAVY